jgi:hypothetical protein
MTQKKERVMKIYEYDNKFILTGNKDKKLNAQ